MSAESFPPSYYIDGIKRNDRIALSRAITVLESTRPEDRTLGSAILSAVSGETVRSLRVAVTGVPGAGKSSLIEALGKRYIAAGQTVAVLAVDPTSHISGGSILGDKTRMPALSVSGRAFVRPSPTRGTLGGLASTTDETILLCEAAGYDIIFVETVGVGQAEIDASDIADMVLLVLIAGAGDDLQGVKRGILEIADVILINKADGENEAPALAARAALSGIIGLMPGLRPDWKRTVLACSVVNNHGIAELHTLMDQFYAVMTASGYLKENRLVQRSRRFDRIVADAIRKTVSSDPQVQVAIDTAAASVQKGELSPRAAGQLVADSLRRLLDSRSVL
jgi:LAO/AO transport system kinase